jgi:uncharacterized protein YjbJ (UPF0337 family)
MSHSGDALVVRWVDRLGRSYQDVCDNIREFMRRSVIVRTVINGLTFDGATNDPMQQAVRDAQSASWRRYRRPRRKPTRKPQKAGIEHAKAVGEAAYKGRKPSFTRQQYETVRDMLAQEVGKSAIANATGLTRQTVFGSRASRHGRRRVLRSGGRADKAARREARRAVFIACCCGDEPLSFCHPQCYRRRSKRPRRSTLAERRYIPNLPYLHRSQYALSIRVEREFARPNENRGEHIIMDKDRIIGSAKEVKGTAKEAIGKATGDAKLQVDGKADQAEGKVRNAIGGVNDAVRDALKK